MSCLDVVRELYIPFKCSRPVHFYRISVTDDIDIEIYTPIVGNRTIAYARSLRAMHSDSAVERAVERAVLRVAVACTWRRAVGHCDMSAVRWREAVDRIEFVDEILGERVVCEIPLTIFKACLEEARKAVARALERALEDLKEEHELDIEF